MSNFQLPDHLLLLLQQATDNYQSIDARRKVGRPPTYSALSFLLLAITAVVLRTFDEIELHRLLLADSDLLTACGFPQPPHRKTIGRRLRTLVPEAETQIQLLGEQIRSALPTAETSISAIDGRMYQATGSRWHKGDRQAGVIPPGLRNVDTESAWSKSNYRGWIQGYRLVVQTLCFPAPVPLFAAWVSNENWRINCCQTSYQRRTSKYYRCFIRRRNFRRRGLNRVICQERLLAFNAQTVAAAQPNVER